VTLHRATSLPRARYITSRGWATIPGYYSLAAARDWHVLFAWIFSVSLLLFMLTALLNGHFKRDLVTSPRDWRPSAIWADVRAHLKLQFERDGAKYNFLQKAAYGVVLFILLPLMIFTGMAISPGMDSAWPFLLDLFGGRQTARTIHFTMMSLLVLFFIVHLVMVLAAGPLNELRSMITGWYRTAPGTPRNEGDKP
jgi:thiosulfate reductase cytochrome b subunit